MSSRPIFIIIFFLFACFGLNSQALVFGLVDNNAVGSDLAALYSIVEEGIMDGCFESGLTSFNVRDGRPFQLETALYSAKAAGCKAVIIWRVSKSSELLYSVYKTNGELAVAETSVKIIKKNIEDLKTKEGREFSIGVARKLGQILALATKGEGGSALYE